VFRALWPPVRTYCERVLGHGADADDAAQQAMEKVFAEAVRYDRSRRALPWAVTIALWSAEPSAAVASENELSRSRWATEVASFRATPEQAAIDRDLLEAASSIFDQLSPSDRDVLRHTLEEVARSAVGRGGSDVAQAPRASLHPTARGMEESP